MLLHSGDTLLFIGDSITDCGRKRPIGEGVHGALGTGYVALLGAMLETRSPHLSCRLVNMGVSGNTSRELLARWETDVLSQSAQIVLVMIGINDVWHTFNRPHQPQTFVSKEEFRDNLKKMAELTLPRVRHMVFISPYFIEPNREEPMRCRMDEFCCVMKEVAQQYGALFIDTQAAFDRLVPRYYHPSALAWDRVHPTLSGHLLLAEACFEALQAAPDT